MAEREAPKAKTRQQARNHRTPPPVTSKVTHANTGADGLLNSVKGQVGRDSNEAAFQQHVALLGDPRMSQRMYDQQRIAIVQRLQTDYGNTYVQRVVERIRAKRAESIQTKLTVGAAGDSYEQEADRVAKAVVSGTAPSESRDNGTDGMQDENLEDARRLIRRQPEAEIARREVSDSEPQPEVGMQGGDITPDVSSMIEGDRGKGQALPDNVKTQMEQGFGTDFNGVRVHTGPKSDELNRTLSAKAFTTGQDIFFADGEYSPGSATGKEVLAHELTHVVQQDGGVQRWSDSPGQVQREDSPESDQDTDTEASEESTQQPGFFSRWMTRGLDAISSAVSSTGGAIAQGYQTAKEIGTTLVQMASDAGSAVAEATVTAAKTVGQAIIDVTVAAYDASVDLKDAAVAKAQLLGKKLADLAVSAGSTLKKGAIAGAEWVVDSAKKTKTYLQDKGILTPPAMTSDEKQAVMQTDRPLEIMAHGLAYNFPTLKDPDTMDAAGYDTSKTGCETYEDGLQFVWILPKTDDGGKYITDPILAFRGTANLENVVSDADPLGIGYLLFEAHTGAIQAKMSELSSKAGRNLLVTGHSLGGALAQRAAMLATDKVSRLVTFQSPGVSDIPVSALEPLAGKVIHHIATRDVVDLAGGFNVPGEYIVHQLPGYMPGITHTYDLLENDNQTIWPYKTYPLSYRLKAMPSEVARAAVGVALSPLVVVGRKIEEYTGIAAKGKALFSYLKGAMNKLLKTKVEPVPEETGAD